MFIQVLGLHHRRLTRFVVFIDTDNLRSKIGDFRYGSVRHKSIPIYREFLNNWPGTSALIMKFSAATTQLIRSISKFDGTYFVEW